LNSKHRGARKLRDKVDWAGRRGGELAGIRSVDLRGGIYGREGAAVGEAVGPRRLVRGRRGLSAICFV
jgi:hypothetical protein